MADLRLDDDERKLAELGYKQELSRSWSGFSNFAISFSIISILAGCFTTFGQAWNNGGPVAISIGWPLVSIFILIIGLCMPHRGRCLGRLRVCDLLRPHLQHLQ